MATPPNYKARILSLSGPIFLINQRHFFCFIFRVWPCQLGGISWHTDWHLRHVILHLPWMQLSPFLLMVTRSVPPAKTSIQFGSLLLCFCLWISHHAFLSSPPIFPGYILFPITSLSLFPRAYFPFWIPTHQSYIENNHVLWIQTHISFPLVPEILWKGVSESGRHTELLKIMVRSKLSKTDNTCLC